MKSKVKKETVRRKDFAEILAAKLIASGLGEVSEGALSDDSGRWVSLRVNGVELCISFDTKGAIIEDVGLFKDVVEVVSQDKIWGT